MRKIVDRLLPAAMATYLVVLPLLSTHDFGAHNLSRIAQLLLLLVGALALLMHQRPLDLSGSLKPWLAGGLTLLTLASTASSALPMIALQELALDLGLISLAVCWARACSPPDSIRMWTIPILASSLYVGLQVLIYGAALATAQPASSWLLSFGYDNPRFLNHTQTLLIPLLVGAAGSSGLSRRWRIAAGAAAVGQLTMLLVTLGRGTMLALLVSGAFAAVALRKEEGRRYAYRLALVTGAGLAAYLLLFVWLPSAIGAPDAASPTLLTEAGGDHSRLKLWQIALDDIRTHPLLGIGPMHFAHYPNPTAAHPHNIYLQIAGEMGLPALGLLASAVMLLMHRAWRLLRALPAGPQADIALAAFIACTAALLDGLVSGNFVMPMPQVWIVFSAGLLAGSLRQASASPNSSRNIPALDWALRIAVLASQLWLVQVALSQALSTPPRIADYSASLLQDDKHRPRFWLDGWF